MLGAAAVLLRLPFRISVLDHWDSVQYALALTRFDVWAHRPQPPGSPYYVLLGRAVLSLVGDAHTVFVLVSLAAGGAAVICEFLLTSRLFGRGAGWLAALALLTQPAFWQYSASGNVWTMLALLSVLAGIACLALLRSVRGATYASALVLGLASGFRLDVAVFLGPLWLWCLWTGERSLGRRCLAVSLLTSLVAVWLLPVVQSVPDGFGAWWSAYVDMFVQPDETPIEIIRVLLTNTVVIWGSSFLLFGPLLAVALVLRRRERLRLQWALGEPRLWTFFALWVLPSFLFLWTFDTSEAGHSLLYTVGLLPALAGLVARSGRSRDLVAAGALVVLLQSSLFFFAVPRTEHPLAFTMDQAILRYNVASLRQHERTVADMKRFVRDGFDPSSVAVITANGQNPYRFAMYYLPEYLVLRVDRPGKGPPLAALQGEESSLSCLPATIRTAVWVAEAPWPTDIMPLEALPKTNGGPATDLWQMSVVTTAESSSLVPGLQTCAT